MSSLQAIPTNVITGFLGVGKTTAILHLLQQKPVDERWAVLVNEFGEVGIDGGLLTGTESEETGVYIREVPGGCMCCAAGLPMQVALNRLLAKAKPDRLIIEPTGLGHPREVLAVLAARHYRDVLDLRATVTLVDARKVHEARYAAHATFQQQLLIADVIAANKSDQYGPGDFTALQTYLKSDLQLDPPTVYSIEQGALQLEWLNAAASAYQEPDHAHHHDNVELPGEQEIPEQGYLNIDNQGEGFFSRGWIFKPEWEFDAEKLYTLLLGLNMERIKGVFITGRGIIAFNKADNVLTDMELDDCLDSRLECISSDAAAFESLEKKLLACVVNP